MMNHIAWISFTPRGRALAEKLCEAMGGTAEDARREGFSLSAWTERAFSEAQALVFVGAAGICVRAIAPFLRNKTEDPAVICLDEAGQFVIPLLSGHLGGANDLARKIAHQCGATPVITTATDVNHLFAVDLWAKKQQLAIINTPRIKAVSAKILAGEEVTVSCPWPVAGEPPELVALGSAGDVSVTFRRVPEDVLALVPHTAVLGVGCRKGITGEQLEDVFQLFCEKRAFYPEAICAVASVDRKEREPGLRAFCKARGWPLRCFSAEELNALPGVYSGSDFVRQTVGTDNVCERAAVLASGGSLIEEKFACGGVTFALAAASPTLDWRF